MVDKKDIINEAVTGIFGEKALEDKYINELIGKYADDIISFDIIEEDGWTTLQHNDPSYPHGFIYYDCHMGRLKDLLDAVEVYLMVEKAYK